MQTTSDTNRDKFGDKLSRWVCSLDSAMLCAEAKRRTGLSDFGEPSVMPPLSLLTRSLEQEVDLHPLGRFLVRMHLRELLETRLRLTAAWDGEHQSIDSSPLRRPIFITGMPRSGSTFLHELLTEDSANRAPRVWEVMSPVSARNSDRGWRDGRVWRAAMCLWWFRRLVPQADAVYPMRARTPHECVAIHSYTLWSEEFISSCRVPSYEAMLRSIDLRPAYEWQRRFLQHLQLGQPEKRWVLKSPDHVYGLDALFAVFPDAVVIQTHRDPVEVVKSSAQLTEALQGLFCRPRDRAQIAEREVAVLAAAMEGFIRFRDSHPELADRFVDVNYSELTADPLKVVRRVYDHFGLSLSERATERMRRMAEQRSRYVGPRASNSSGSHIPAQVGLFNNYCQRFGIPFGQARTR